MGAERAEQLATKLTSGTWTHDYPITVEEARELGLPVSTEMPKEVYQLMGLYPQTSQRRPSVEYIPSPRSNEPMPHTTFSCNFSKLSRVTKACA